MKAVELIGKEVESILREAAHAVVISFSDGTFFKIKAAAFDGDLLYRTGKQGGEKSAWQFTSEL